MAGNGVAVTYRWTPTPTWYTARGWRKVAEKVGVGYHSVLVVRVLAR